MQKLISAAADAIEGIEGMRPPGERGCNFSGARLDPSTVGRNNHTARPAVLHLQTERATRFFDNAQFSKTFVPTAHTVSLEGGLAYISTQHWRIPGWDPMEHNLDFAFRAEIDMESSWRGVQ
jgi:hypothetical protein